MMVLFDLVSKMLYYKTTKSLGGGDARVGRLEIMGLVNNQPSSKYIVSEACCCFLSFFVLSV
jgi:hypothetical protein